MFTDCVSLANKSNIMKVSAIVALVSSAAIMMASCARVETGSIVLQGNVQGDPGQIIVVSFLPGQPMDYHYPAVNGGRFEFTMAGVSGFADLIVSVGGVEFGARVNALDTLRMDFVVNEPGKDVEVSYDGTTEKESRIWKDFYETYHRWSSYNLPRTDPEKSYDDCIVLLDGNDAKFRADHKADMNRYYTHRAELSYALLKAILLDMKADEEGSSSYGFPEYKELMAVVDPNDPDEVTFPLVNRWAYFHMAEFGDDPVISATEFLKKYGKKITNPVIKSMLAENISSYCMFEPDFSAPEKYETFFETVSRFVPDGPEIVEACRRKIEAAGNALPGNPAPDTMMETIDGGEVQLSSMFGKVLYIDVWATWCGPCVAEAPYFRKIAEKFKGDGRIGFISLSVDRDSDRDKWVEFVDKEKPFWPQFRLAGTNQDDFCNKVGINTIPRFLLIGPDGRFIDGDCARPSDGNIENILNEAISSL